MAVEIRVFLAIDAFRRISGTVFAFGVKSFSFSPNKPLILNAKRLETVSLTTLWFPLRSLARVVKRVF